MWGGEKGSGEENMRIGKVEVVEAQREKTRKEIP